MRIAIGADHAAYGLKEDVKGYLKERGHEVEDLGTHSEETTDYPPICAAVARAVRDGRADRGVVLGGSGQGEQMTANKVRGIRAALCHDLYTARMARSHNDANVLSMGARIVAREMALLILETWLQTEFEGGRHERRVGQIMEIEREETAGEGRG
jgi:ribose 5-phosphate isomerase B